MEETREQQKLHGFLQCAIYVSVLLEAALFIYPHAPFWGIFEEPMVRLARLPVYASLIHSKLFTLGLICLVSIGTLAKKRTDLDPKRHILYPLLTGLLLFFGSLLYRGRASFHVFPYTTLFDVLYVLCSLSPHP